MRAVPRSAPARWTALVGLGLGLGGCHAAPAPAPPAAAPTPAAGPLAGRVRTETVALGALHRELEVVGSVAYDQDHYAIVGPQVTGRVVALYAGLGDSVGRGEALAEIESPEVGRAASEFVATRARATAAEANLSREVALHERKISSAREYELARAQAAVEGAAHRAAGQQLQALGVRAADLAQSLHGGSRVVLRAPFAATVVERSVSLGESVGHGTDAFVLANLDHLWVLLDVYERDLARLAVGQPAVLRAESLPAHPFQAVISYVDMRVDPANRTAQVRVALDNRDRLLRPGQFVSARLGEAPGDRALEVIRIPKKAVVVVDARTLVFVREGADYLPRQVFLGRTDHDTVEVQGGLAAGDELVVEGAFLLKSTHFR